jgi:pre-mRNA-splicing factor SPF27
LERTREALSRAYVSNSYLSWREEELQLLEQHGKNAWLVHNWQLESDLKVLEAELARARADVDRLTVERQRSQQMVEGEMKGLEEQWRKGVGRVLEVEVAVEGVKGEIRERMRG